MLYFIHGTNREGSRAKAAELLDILKTKRPEATVISMSLENATLATLEELAGEQGLFDSKVIVFLDGLSADESFREKMIEWASIWKKSPNAFVVLEAKPVKEVEKVFSKEAEKTFTFASLEKKEYSIFPLADAIGARDRKLSWTKLREALDNETVPEEIHGVIFWQVKSMLLAQEYESAGPSGLSPFVFSKSKRYAKNFTKDELLNISRSLVSMYHDSHRGETNLAVELEKFVLGI